MTTREPSDLRTGTHDPLRLPYESWRRLYGLACVRCGGGQGLEPCGHAYTQHPDGGRLGWAVQICADCERHSKTTDGDVS
ncbi:hypothetical protein OOK58_35350 [Streptomyces sp. NBC_01728]|uniref:hypothetical protein n=1 Tax=unclassified Streptomyces TaxID=2593676 RepID=UPI00225AE1A7|nr:MULTISPECIES: hypothetical protein [unclassified Streptomyces]MCX4457238.1 hypothetical protein [Streptomyces sp. NBC_01719]MCX4496595.1 hypothetical protein [Streptomyces sp. NBC_01728]MCX4588814.1 hypothetical protein [Streptomyces sp. NBC_01549]